MTIFQFPFPRQKQTMVFLLNALYMCIWQTSQAKNPETTEPAQEPLRNRLLFLFQALEVHDSWKIVSWHDLQIPFPQTLTGEHRMFSYFITNRTINTMHIQGNFAVVILCMRLLMKECATQGSLRGKDSWLYAFLNQLRLHQRIRRVLCGFGRQTILPFYLLFKTCLDSPAVVSFI